MRRPALAILAAAASALVTLAGCGDRSTLPVNADVGPSPQLPAPRKTLIPTVDIAPAKGWPQGGKPQAAPGLEVNAMATGLDHPRWLYVLPNGDVLVAESNKPQTPETKKAGLRTWVMGKVMAKAGAGVPSADRITLLRDADGDGVAETRSVFLQGLHSPFGMALVGDTLYIANADAIVRVPYREGATAIAAAPQQLAPLPAGLNHHWTKNILASRDGSKLYASVGSNSNVGENGMKNEVNRAAILEVDVKTGGTRLFASGLRNPNGMAWEPQTGALWTVVNERDEIGSDLVPDYLTSVQDGAFYGWPYSYYGQHVDERARPQRPEMVAKAIAPDYALGAHVAALGLAFAEGARLGPAYASGAFIGQHGSWNRKPLSGYNVVYVPFENGKPSGMPVEVLRGFVDGDGNAMGRPVGVAIDKRGALLVADDVGNVVWRVRPAAR
ncbi:sorbosone dehydrogenase family protein [Massilia sp.]|uniref:PQQ-dependent sugar dehydrogenase n=1 Tax=Massilia sp. TaxID=1882437 RepID=UPI000EEF53FB|nr:sorbosone dehydrogenase family protein [Massilia sp.]HBZ07081.1 sorbosone dehydrogenase [Massilia sp.]